jgi:hypothetical protein
MRRFLAVAALLLASCGGRSDDADHSAEWRRILDLKKTAVASNANARDKQLYADALAAFTDQHPQHGRAREVYEHIQLDFADELSSLGRYQDAIRFYRAVLATHPGNQHAIHGIASAMDRLAVSRAKLLALEKGMSQRDVAKLLGKPIPGWTARTARHDAVMEAWYYRKTDGGIAGVYFRDGELLAAEENSHAKLAPLVR